MNVLTLKKELLSLLQNTNDNDFNTIEFDLDDEYIRIICPDNSIFTIQIVESEFCNYMINDKLVSDDSNIAIDKYLESHTREDFLEDLDRAHKNNPKYFELIIVLMKIIELGLLSYSTADRICKKINHIYFPNQDNEYIIAP